MTQIFRVTNFLPYFLRCVFLEGQFRDPMGDCNVTGRLRSDRWLRCCIPTTRFGETFSGDLRSVAKRCWHRMEMLRRKKSWKTSGNFFQRRIWRIPLIKKTMSPWLLVLNLGLKRCTLSVSFYQEYFGSCDRSNLQHWWVGRSQLPCCAGINHCGWRGPDYECRKLFAQKRGRLEVLFLLQSWKWRTGFCKTSFLCSSVMFINFPLPRLWEEESQRKMPWKEASRTSNIFTVCGRSIPAYHPTYWP